MDDIFSLQDDELDLSDDEILASFDPQVSHSSLRPSKTPKPNISESRSLQPNKNTINVLLENRSDSPHVRVSAILPESENVIQSNKSFTVAKKQPLPSIAIGLENTSSPARKRKFPGPAGILPALGQSPILENQLQFKHRKRKSTTPKKDAADTAAHTSLDERDDDCYFSTGLWPVLINAANEMEGFSPLDITNVLQMASQSTLKNGKVPLMVVLLKSFSFTEGDAVALLSDPSGEIRGTVHKGVLERYQSDLIPGAGLVLCHISVFSPNAKRHYINITPTNVMRVIPPYSTLANGSRPTEIDLHEELQKLKKISPLSSGAVSKVSDKTKDPLNNQEFEKNNKSTSASTRIVEVNDDLIDFDEDDDFSIDEDLFGT